MANGALSPGRRPSFLPTRTDVVAPHQRKENPVQDDTQDPDFGSEDVRVNVFETTAMADGAVDFVRDTSAKLDDLGWEPVVTVREPDDLVHVLVKLEGETVSGLTVLVLDAEEAVLVNVMGNLRPESFGQAMVALDVTVPDIQLAAAP